MKKGRMHACILLSLIAFAALSLIVVVKALTEKPFRIEPLLGIIGCFLGTFLYAVFIPIGMLNFVFAFFFSNIPREISAGIMCAWLYFGGVICANAMYHRLEKGPSSSK